LPWIPLGQFTALIQTPYLDLKGELCSGEGMAGEGKGWDVKKGKGRREREVLNFA